MISALPVRLRHGRVLRARIEPRRRGPSDGQKRSLQRKRCKQSLCEAGGGVRVRQEQVDGLATQTTLCLTEGACVAAPAKLK
jgi:hypothetical protein